MGVTRLASLSFVALASCGAPAVSPPARPPAEDAGVNAEAVAVAPDPTGFRVTGAMHHARRAHTSTVLNDGRVLVVGGEAGDDLHMLDSAEVFDPSTEKWTELPRLPAARSNHSATLLKDGRVLIAGGGKSSIIGEPSGEAAISSALLFDPSTDTFSETGPLTSARSSHGAARLADGRVVVVGGGGADVMGPCPPQYPSCFIAKPIASAEIYDPATDRWSALAPLSEARHSFALVPLASGAILAAAGAKDGGGGTATTELFDPATLSWSAGPKLSVDRLHPSVTRLGDGRILIAAGKKANIGPLDTAEIFSDGAWSPAAKLQGARNGAILVTLSSGNALIVGGFDQIQQKILDAAAIYDVPSASWRSIRPLVGERSLHTAVTLRDGRVLVCGGAVDVGAELKTCTISE